VPLADKLLDHASRLLKSQETEADLRRAVSASYYAVFHLIAAAVGSQASPASPPGLGDRIQRVLEHRAMKNAMESFRTRESCARLSANIGISCEFSRDLAEIAKAYGELQDARHLADYDVADSDGTVGLAWASDCFEKARRIFEAWDRTQSMDEARLFLATLMFGARWAK
jgi:uncharacterized protein (UPF0332 family)